MASWQKKAADRRQRGQDEAKQIRADYKRKADELQEHTKTVIKGHEDSEKRENDLEDAAYKRDLETYEQIRQQAYKDLDGILTDFDLQAQNELDAYDDYVQTQTAVIKKATADEFRTATEELQKDHDAKSETVRNEVTTKLGDFETKLNGATQKELATLAKEFNGRPASNDTSAAKVTGRSMTRAKPNAQTPDNKVTEIQTRASKAVAAIENEARILAVSKIDAVRTQADDNRARVDREANRRAQNSYVRQRAQAENDNVGPTERNNQLIRDANTEEQKMRPVVYAVNYYTANVDYSLRTERSNEIEQEAKQLQVTRRELKTGQAAVTPQNAPEKRTEVLSAFQPTDINVLNGNADPSKAMSILSTLTREELNLMYPPGSEERKALLDAAYKHGLADEIDAMIGSSQKYAQYENTSNPQAIALKWALANGDKKVADSIFNSMTTDKERAELDRVYQSLTGKSIRDSFDNVSDADKKQLNVSWDAGRTMWNGQYTRTDGADLTDQWNQDRSRREALETVSAYNGADKNKLLQLRSEMLKRHSGPFLDEADKQRHQAELQKELEQFDSTVFTVSGKTMETMDSENTAGKVREALLATSRRVVIDPNEPDFTRPEADWNKFGVTLMQRSIEKNDYDTRLAENFLGKLPVDKRKELLDQYQLQNRTSFVDDVNNNVRTSQAKTSDSADISYRKSKLGDPNDLGSTTQKSTQKVPASEIDADALISIANSGEVPDALRLIQLKNGRGRGDEADQKEFGSTINKVTSTEKGFSEVSTQYEELLAKYNLGRTGDANADLIKDAKTLLAPRQARKAVFEINTSGEERNPEWDKKRRDEIWVNDSRLPQGLREALEGPAGREVFAAKEKLDQELEQMRRDGTSTMTKEEIAEVMAKSNPPPFTAEQLERYANYQTSSDAVVAADETMKTSYEQNVRNAALFAATGVVVVGTIMLTGPLGPVVAGVISSAAGGLTTMGIKYASFGSDYNPKELRQDVNGMIVDAIVGGVVAGGAVTKFANKLVGRVGQAWARELLAEAISLTVVNSSSELTKILLDPDTYVGNPDQIREKMLSRIKKAAITGAVTGGTKGALNSRLTSSSGLTMDQLGKGVRTGVEVTSNVVGVLPTATSASEVLNAAIQGLSAYTDGANVKTSESTALETTTQPTPRSKSSLETVEPNTRMTETKQAEVQTLRDLYKQKASIKARPSVDENGRRVYDVTTVNGETFVVKGPRNESSGVIPNGERTTTTSEKNDTLVRRESTDLVSTQKDSALVMREPMSLVAKSPVSSQTLGEQIKVLGAGTDGNPILERLPSDANVYRVQSTTLDMVPHDSPFFDPSAYSLPPGEYQALYVCSDWAHLEKLRREQGYFDDGLVMHETSVEQLLKDAGPGSIVVADVKFNMSVLGAEQGGYIIVRRKDGQPVGANPRELTPVEVQQRTARQQQQLENQRQVETQRRQMQQRDSIDALRSDARDLSRELRRGGQDSVADAISELIAPARMQGRETRLLKPEDIAKAADALRKSEVLATLERYAATLPTDLATRVRDIAKSLDRTFDLSSR